MPSGPVLAVILGLIGVALFVAGILNLTHCGGGLSIALFGLGIACFGGSAASVGGFTVLIVAGIFGLILFVIGTVVNYGACGTFPF